MLTESGTADRDPLVVLFGEPGDDFVQRYAGRAVAVSHAPLARLEPLLEKALVTDFAALVQLAGRYSQPIRAAVVGDDGILGYRTLTGDRATTISAAAGDWFLFDHLQGHFNAMRRMLLELCWLFGYPRLGATCTGFLHTSGAGVPRHCDEFDVVVIQLFGRRRWCLEANTIPPVGVWDPVEVSARSPAGWDPAFGPTSQIVELGPGSALYMPGAWWHQTQSSAASFSISVVLPGATADPDRILRPAEPAGSP